MKAIIISRNSNYDSSIPHPPIGSIGTVLSDMDDEGDLDIYFAEYPCPVSEPEWVININMVVFLDDNKVGKVYREEDVAKYY